MFIRRATVTVVTATAVLAAGGGVASANGSIGNACAVDAPVFVTRVAPDGLYSQWILCGHGAGDVTYATVDRHPFYVTLPGRAPVCYAAGARFYPPASTAWSGREAVITPTVRCTPTANPGPRPGRPY